MNENQPSNNVFEIWRQYRSTLLGRPVTIKQAYNSIYPWIEYDGVYFNRCYEMCLYLLFNRFDIPEQLKPSVELLQAAHYSIINGAKVFGEIAMAKPSNNKLREYTLKTKKSIAVCGNVKINVKNFECIVYTDIWNLGGNYCISREQCLKKSYEMPVLVSPDVLLEDKNSMIYYPNVWVWED